VSTCMMEPRRTEAEFKARHMMVSLVRGLFRDIHGRLEFDWDPTPRSELRGRTSSPAAVSS
jgi:polyisoprenoid-binding protein YceI